eukprot:TRINITY_DN49196_c0_g1_i1.p1 TRINITY_DN49196_c0_g1~~TRINITY_DN49196_c0_g1_i1.p1  ORF type:complete len:314 (+),score=43.81 TRINITY_DN49196_c0_g1_i1:64-942(+)
MPRKREGWGQSIVQKLLAHQSRTQTIDTAPPTPLVPYGDSNFMPHPPPPPPDPREEAKKREKRKKAKQLEEQKAIKRLRGAAMTHQFIKALKVAHPNEDPNSKEFVLPSFLTGDSIGSEASIAAEQQHIQQLQQEQAQREAEKEARAEESKKAPPLPGFMNDFLASFASKCAYSATQEVNNYNDTLNTSQNRKTTTTTTPATSTHTTAAHAYHQHAPQTTQTAHHYHQQHQQHYQYPPSYSAAGAAGCTYGGNAQHPYTATSSPTSSVPYHQYYHTQQPQHWAGQQHPGYQR